MKGTDESLFRWSLAVPLMQHIHSDIRSLILIQPYKGCFGHWELRIGKLLFGAHSSESLHSVPYAQMPNAQLPIESNSF